MRVTVSDATFDERRLLAQVVQQVFPEAEILAAGGQAEPELYTDHKAASNVEDASGLDGDLQAAALEALSQKEAALRYQATLLENVNDAIVAYDAVNLRITAWNHRAEEQYGWTAEEALGRYAPEMVGSRLDPEQRAKIVRSVAETGRWRGELKHTRRDGTLIVVETTSTALYDDTGRVVAHVTANRDITERKRMEEELKAQKERQQILHEELVQRQAALERANEALRYQASLLENVNDAVIAFDDRLRITAWNHAAEELYGWRAEEVMGAYSPDVVRSEATAEERAARLRVMAEIGKWKGEITHKRRDGTPVVVELTSMTLRDETGRIYAHVTVNRDITERKRADKELRANQEHLQSLAHRLVEMQENERYEVANQLYNDEGQRLAALILGLGRLQRENHVDEAGAALVAELTKLADGVLADMHSLAVDLRPASLDRLGLRAALEQAMTGFGRQANIEVQCELAAIAVPALSAHVETNIFRIVQDALANIARHAKASCVSLTGVRRDGKLVLILEDDGVGFDVEQARQAGSLGLLAMHERAEAMGGTLDIESLPGSGTTLYIQVPEPNA